MPAPEAAGQAYAEAIEKADSDALYSMLTTRARRDLSKAELEELLRVHEDELKEFATDLRKEQPRASGHAQLFLDDSRIVELNLQDGQFLVRGDGVLPVRPSSPEVALERLRQALAAKNYAMVLALLTESGRTRVEGLFESLQEAFEQVDSATFELRQDRAVVEFSTGRRLFLRQIDGAWYIEEIQ